MRSLPLTPRQREVRDHLEAFVDAHGYPPTLQELSASCGLGGPTGAQRMLDTLERKGYVRRPRGRKRAYALAEPDLEVGKLRDEDVLLLAVMTACHGHVRDAELHAATTVEDEAVREGLLADALARQQLVARVTAQVPEVATVPQAIDVAGLIAEGFERDGAWPAFAVGFLVFNRLTVVGATAWASEAPQLEASLWRSARTSAQAARSARSWIGDSLRSEGGSRRMPAFRQAAAAMARRCHAAKTVLPGGHLTVGAVVH